MRFGVLRDGRIVGVTHDDVAVDVSDILPGWAPGSSADELMTCMGRHAEHGAALRARLADPAPGHVLDGPLELVAPSPRPRTVLAAPVNYRSHAGELGARSPDGGRLDARQLGLVVVAAASITGPDSVVELPPLPDREFHFEGEVGVVIGRTARAVSPDEALSHVLGYTGLLDITMRIDEDRREDRSMRKSLHTFTPIGPYVLTADEVEDPAELELRLLANGVQRQHGSLRDLIVGVPELVALASSVVVLRPGDVIATGTPEGVGPIVEGDELELDVPRVGQLRVRVGRRAW